MSIFKSSVTSNENAEALRSKYQRKSCACERCSVGCRTLPGSLIVLDIERIATQQKVTPTPEWVKAHFQASEGAQFLIKGEQVGVPSIVPAQRADGSCVFLNETGQCTVHRVSPFNCAYADEHMSDEEYRARRNDAIKVQMQSWMTGDTYTQWWNILAEAGCFAKPTAERRAAYELAAQKLKTGDQPGDRPQA